jgi:hypothetical protein
VVNFGPNWTTRRSDGNPESDGTLQTEMKYDIIGKIALINQTQLILYQWQSTLQVTFMLTSVVYYSWNVHCESSSALTNELPKESDQLVCLILWSQSSWFWRNHCHEDFYTTWLLWSVISVFYTIVVFHSIQTSNTTFNFFPVVLFPPRPVSVTHVWCVF